MRMGLPDGVLRAAHGPRLDSPEAIREAVRALVAQDLDPTETDVLAAWLSAFRHHWPSAFSEVLGEVGEAGVRRLLPKVELNRYLKLRRIAIANLANLL